MSWYIAVAQPQKEFWVAQYAQECGFRAYCPRRMKWTAPRRKRKGFFTPVAAFPRYVFLEAKPGCSSLVSGCPEAGRMVRLGNDLAEITERQREAIETLEAAGWFDDSAPGQKRLSVRPGDRFEISEGSMVGLEGEVDRVIDEARSLVRLLVHGWKIDLPLSILRKLGHKENGH